MEHDEMQPPVPSQHERRWAMGCHLAALLGIFIPMAGVNLLGPLVLWLIKRIDGAFIDDQGKEALNFQISLALYAFIGWLFFLVGGWLLVAAVRFVGLIMVIIAAVKAGDGIQYRYPACIRFVK
jgi:uncharacterized Tic20 family protein